MRVTITNTRPQTDPATELPTTLKPQYAVPSFSTIQLLLDKYIINTKTPVGSGTWPEKLLSKGISYNVMMLWGFTAKHVVTWGVDYNQAGTPLLRRTLLVVHCSWQGTPSVDELDCERRPCFHFGQHPHPFEAAYGSLREGLGRRSSVHFA